ncbi:hypothetical protein CCB80_02745 [Armatimonadetes bacterium Uphvl-Ar1]|nr:hypothetical protein CCB80_02745 [Armatimonadetes bacterium Uphvl-Ar1]
MPFYMRFFDTSQQGLELEELRPVFTHPAKLTVDGDLFLNDFPIAMISIEDKGDSLFEEEIEEFQELLEDEPSPAAREVEITLDKCQRIVIVQLFNSQGSLEESLQRIDLLWNHLTSSRTGLVQVDGEGFYNSERLILEM